MLHITVIVCRANRQKNILLKTKRTYSHAHKFIALIFIQKSSWLQSYSMQCPPFRCYRRVCAMLFLISLSMRCIHTHTHYILFIFEICLCVRVYLFLHPSIFLYIKANRKKITHTLRYIPTSMLSHTQLCLVEMYNATILL